jgi:site-specific recombinase XerD
MLDKTLRPEAYRKLITHQHSYLPTPETNEYIKAATSENIRKAYRSDIKHFIRWGGLLPAKTDMVIQYLQHHAKALNARTLARRLISIRHWHVLQGYADPTANPAVSKTLKGIKRTHGKPKRKASGLLFEHIQIDDV